MGGAAVFLETYVEPSIAKGEKRGRGGKVISTQKTLWVRKGGLPLKKREKKTTLSSFYKKEREGGTGQRGLKGGKASCGGRKKKRRGLHRRLGKAVLSRSKKPKEGKGGHAVWEELDAPDRRTALGDGKKRGLAGRHRTGGGGKKKGSIKSPLPAADEMKKKKKKGIPHI